MTDCIQLDFQTLKNVAKKGFRIGSYHHVERGMIQVHKAGSKPSHHGIIFGLWSGSGKIQYWLRCDRYVHCDVFWLFNKLEDAMEWESRCRVIRTTSVNSNYPPSITLTFWVKILERLALLYTYELVTYNCQTYCRILSSLFCIHNRIQWKPPEFTFVRFVAAILTLGQSEYCVLKIVSECGSNII
jgi:hypothetical protein